MSVVPTRRPFEARVIGEKSELDTRIFALKQFLESPLFKNVDKSEQFRLQRQAYAMQSYADILKERIDAFPPVVGVLPTSTTGNPSDTTDLSNVTSSNVTELNPELAGQAVFKEAVPIGAEAIKDVDSFAMLVDHWHAQCIERGNRVLEIPEGTIIELEDAANPGKVIEMDLNGPYLQTFRIGAMTVLHLFKDLPFGASMEEVTDDSVTKE